MNNFLITVRVADREYRLNIDRKQEELVRVAAQTINEHVKKYAESYEFKDKQDLLAMVVLQNTVKSLELEKQLNFQQEQLSGKLDDIDKILSDNLSKE